MPCPCRQCGSPEVSPKRAARSDYRCADCANAADRAYRAANPRSYWTTDEARAKRRALSKLRLSKSIERVKHRVRAAARHAIAAGKLVRLPCEVCGAAKVEAHHDDYSKPVIVRWLCPAHHREHHAAERAQRRAA